MARWNRAFTIRRVNQFLTGHQFTLDQLDAKNAQLCDQLRDLIGYPFRQVSIHSAWLDPDVLAIAKQMLKRKSFEKMPILADALEEAGCDDEEILAHCRNGKEHVAGCWLLELILEKGPSA